jgi:hypothetical protein
MDGEPLEDQPVASRRYDCLEWDTNADHVTGISPGWMDVYSHELADQYIEITGVPDGHYLIVTQLDPSRTIRERTRRDNRTSTHILICGDEVAPARRGAECD